MLKAGGAEGKVIDRPEEGARIAAPPEPSTDRQDAQTSKKT
jgi:hypothetical protein